MITKAVIEQKISEYQYRVRIPIFDRSQDASFHTDTKDLCIATVITPKGIYNNFSNGDVVFVDFENNEMGHPVIIGHLYRELLTQDRINSPIITARILDITQSATLPQNITIGQIGYNQLFSLSGINSNIQEQLNSLSGINSNIQEQLNSFYAKLEDIESKINSLNLNSAKLEE